MVIWVTGLSASGKTTLAKGIATRLRTYRLPVVFLDGDQMRSVLGEEGRKAYTRDERLELALKYSRMSKMLADQRCIVVTATISMFQEVYEWNRFNIVDYLEIYLNVSLTELEQRDPKGIYKRFREGAISNVAGLDLPVDEPYAPDLTLYPNGNCDSEQTFSECWKQLGDEISRTAKALCRASSVTHDMQVDARTDA